MDETDSFGEWLKQRRRALHLTQEALAEQLYCALGTVRKLEADERHPSQELAERLAQVLQVPPEHHTTFVKVARAEMALDRLALPPDPTIAPKVTSSQPPTNMRLSRSSFVGRDAERAQLHAMLLRADVGLVTLTGPGGTGKTRLALEVGATLRDDFADGVWFVNLAPISDPALVVPTIAHVLGVQERGQQTLSDLLTHYIRDKVLLLLLDNFEQVLGAAQVVADLLGVAPRLTVLVTSRAPLRLRGEHEYAVPPFAVPDPQHLPTLAMLTQYDAVRLFIARAQEVQADFVVTNANAPAVAEICVRLDGLPLAIELAAARVRLFPPQALLSRLGSRLTLLTGGARDLPARQQTMRGAIDWSYSLLAPAEQILFARLAVFVGARTFAAIEAVCNPDGGLAVLADFESLVENSLVRQEVGTGDEPRFVMLETIHEYAHERLEGSGEVEVLRQRHAAYFRQVAEAVQAEIELNHQRAAMGRIMAEQDNLRAALTWALERREGETALWLALALSSFWSTSAQYSEGRQWLEAALAMTQPAQAAVPEAGPASAVRAKVLRRAAEFARFLGDYGAGRLHAEEALAVIRASTDKRAIAESLEVLAHVFGSEGDFTAGRARTAEALALQRELGDPTIAGLLNNGGWAAYLDGDDAQALVLLEESLALHRNVGDTSWELNSTLHSLGAVLIAYTDYARAGALLTEGLRLAQHYEDISPIMWSLEGLAWLAAAECMTRDQPGAGATRAARLFGAAQALRETSGEVLLLAEQSLQDRYLAIAQAHLNEEAWQTAWAEGQAMPLEQAITYALDV